MSAKRKVLLICLDGFTWQLLRRFLDGSAMGRLAQLVRSGCHGVLHSVIPFCTAPAWTSFMTGCRPGKTTVLTFHTYDKDRRGVRSNSYADIAVPTLWELAHAAGKTVVSINLPMTFPAPTVKGIIIPGLMCPALSADSVHPPGAYDKYIKPEKGYRIVDAETVGTVSEFVERQNAVELARCRVGLRIMQQTDWDLFCYQIQSSDHVQHQLWSALDAELSAHQPEHYQQVVRFYKCCDEIIGRLVDAAGADTLTLLASDHGFTRLRYNIHINVWLRKKGYLHLKPTPTSSWTAAKDILKTHVPFLRRLARRYGRRFSRSGWNMSEPFLAASLDIERSAAFQLGYLTGQLYLSGAPTQKEALAQKLTHELLADLGPESAQPLISRITAGADTFAGLDPVRCPDLVLHYRPGTHGHTDPRGDQVVTAADSSDNPIALRGTHSRDGIFVAAGPDIAVGTMLDADIIDIAPTVLAWLALPIPRHIDGKVLEAAFTHLPPVRYCDAEAQRRESTTYTDQEQTQLEQRLAELGYL